MTSSFTLSICAKEWKTPFFVFKQKTCTQRFTAALFTIVKRWKQPKCLSTDEWVNKMWYIHTMTYYLAKKRNQVIIHATTWMKLENIVLRERSQRHKRLCITCFHLYEIPRIGKFIENRKQIKGCGGWGNKSDCLMAQGFHLG